MSPPREIAGRVRMDATPPVAAVVTAVVSIATAAVALTAPAIWAQAKSAPAPLLAFLVVSFALALVVIDVYGRGSVSFAGSGALAVGFAFGVGPAMAVAAVCAAATSARRHAPVEKAMFDVANLALAAAAGSAVFHVLVRGSAPVYELVAGSLAAAAAYLLTNVGLLCFVMSVAEREGIVSVWKERFRWFTPYYLASGPLALMLVIAYEQVGVLGLLAFALPPAFMMLSVRQYLARTKAAVDEVRAANAALEARNDDLADLFQFASGLAASVHGRESLISYTEEAVRRLTGGRLHVRRDSELGATPLVAGGTRVGSIDIEETPEFDAARWNRLRDAIVPQLATAVESVDLIEQVRRQHVATIAALSRSMEAKDYYTGSHTERVSTVAVALAKRLGYVGAELDAIEIGALLHDIGKIGIPEHILRKQGPLDDTEWQVMKEHPVISEYILAGTELSPIVLEIARSSHERIDGAGYPDGKKGDEIPLTARIVLVADAFDALTSDRPYRRGRHAVGALEEIRLNAGTQFCAAVVGALERVYREEPHLLGGGVLRAVDGASA